MKVSDIFAGTGIVGKTFKTSVKKVISNDIEYYSYVLNKNYSNFIRKSGFCQMKLTNCQKI